MSDVKEEVRKEEQPGDVLPSRMIYTVQRGYQRLITRK